MSTELIRELRERTNCGVKDCKDALAASDNDIDKAIEYLRKKGLAAAEKKAMRSTGAGSIFSYIHAGGQIGVLLELNCETDFVANTDQFKELGKDLCMQVCAMSPIAVNKEGISQATIDREKAIYEEQIEKELDEKAKGKKGQTEKARESIKEKMMEGKMAKFFKDATLLGQSFIKDDKRTVEEIIKEKIGTIKENITVKRFIRFEIGEK